MRTALSGVSQWFKDAWSLPWKLKGPFAGVVAALVLAVGVVAVTGDAGDPKEEAARLIALSPTAQPTVVATIETTVVVEEVEVPVPVSTVIVQSPTPEAGEFYAISAPYTFSGDNRTITNDFCVTGAILTVEYSAVGRGQSPDLHYLNVSLYDGARRYVIDAVRGLKGSGTFNLRPDGPGCYYLEIDPYEASWTVTVSQ